MNSLRSKVQQGPGTSAGWSDSRPLSSRYGWGQAVGEREALCACVASGRGLQSPLHLRQSDGEEATLHGDLWVLARAAFSLTVTKSEECPLQASLYIYLLNFLSDQPQMHFLQEAFLG